MSRRKGRAMRILVYGAGAMGTYFGYKLLTGGNEISFVARGARRDTLQKGAAQLEDVTTGTEFRHPFPVWERVPEGEHFDLVLVTVKSHQMQAALEEVETVSADWIILMGMYVTGMGEWRDRLGTERVYFAFPGASAVVQGSKVLFVEGGDEDEQVWGVTIGGLHGEPSEQTGKVAKVFIDAGIPVNQSGDMAAVFMSQAAVRMPILAALELAGGDLDKLYDRGDLLKLMVKGIREALAAVRIAGYSPVPSSLSMYRYVPIFIIANMIKHRFSTQASRIGIEAFGKKSKDETSALSRQLLETVRGLGGQCEHLEFLFDHYM
jgi:2-dehydropantoate 2-reductase